MEQPFSTSKVTVEYFDPHGVYKLVAPGLIPRLPLRNLHWQSHAGPLRSIETLHIELLPEGSTDPRPVFSPDPFFPALQRSASNTAGAAGGRDSDGFQTQIGSIGGNLTPESTDKGGTAGHQALKPARRHQIPGLRRTPYLKVLLVRCDDNDNYKGSVRQEIREWIKVHTTPKKSSSTSAENHDAFEWLIIHVVVPNTVAATQPRTTADVGEKSAVASAASRWRGGSSTIFEKLRSDFSSSSKGAVERIAQVRIGINDVPYDTLPRVVPAVPSGYKETEEEVQAAWDDLITKMRSLILSSFDMRVSQYEDDIKERDAQRSLPGWNFCTFFILKEGLARGFESVGLVEDALVGYDELSVGLDMVVKDQLSGGSTAANTMLSYTDDLKQLAVKAQSELYGEGDDEVVDMSAPQQKSVDSSASFDEIPINSSKKPYRELILENNVSVFDFRCYIFARQIALLLRLGNAWSTREELLAKLKEQQESALHGVAPRVPPRQTENEHENLSMLAEICRRTLEFIPSVSQVMRADLLVAMAETKSSDEGVASKPHDAGTAEIIDNLVASFAFSIAQQVLAQTSTKALPIPPTTIAAPDGHEPKAAIPEPKTMMHPTRSSSLRISTGGARVGRPPPSPNVFTTSGRPSGSESSTNTAFLKAGLEDLAARRAELYTLSRNILEECGKKRGWSDGWDGVPVIGQSTMVDLVEIDLDADSTPAPPAEEAALEKVVFITGLDSKLLRTALDNLEDFYRLYEALTDKALRHYTVANYPHSVQACMADLAVLKYHVGENVAASSYFWRTTPFFGESGWSLLELSMLVMYSQCLKQLRKKDDYVKVMLKLLSKAAAAERDRQSQRSSLRLGEKTEVEFPDSEAIKGCLTDLLAETKTLQSPVKVPLSSFFSVVEVDGTPEYHDGKDSFSVYLKLGSLLVDEFKIDQASAQMIGHISGAQREISLQLSSPVTIRPGRNKIKLDGNVVIPGMYELEKIDLNASNIRLHYERDPNKSTNILKSLPIAIYHRADTLDIQLAASNHLQLDRNNTVDIDINSGWNNITSAEVRVKAATGGLRLLTTEAKCVTSSYAFSKLPEGGLFSFDAIPKRQTVKIRFPFTVENEVLTVAIRIEVSYTTEDGTFVFSKTPTIPISLALGVNVQDVFKHKALFSRFTVSTASASPLRLLKSELVGSEVFESDFGIPPERPIVVFPRQPAALLYKITRKKGVKSSATSGKILYLRLHYSVVQDEIAAQIEQSVATMLRDAGLKAYARLLADTIVPLVYDDLDHLSLERAALLGNVPTDFVKGVNWMKRFAGLGKQPDGRDISAVLAEFMKQWLEKNKTVVLSDVKPSEPRSILIPVDIPSVTIVHTADIRLKLNEQLLSPTAKQHTELTTNQLVPATLNLKWTRVWDTTVPIKDMTDLEFSYDIVAPMDTWLIGGRKKGHFVIPVPSSASPDHLSSTVETEAEIPLMLIPLREGHLPYPSVDIRQVMPSAGGPGDSGGITPIEGPSSVIGAGDDGSLGHCETDWRNLGETVRVVPDRQKVTLSLDAAGPGGGPLVLQVERRGLETWEGGRVVC